MTPAEPASDLQADVEAVRRLSVVPTILDVVCQMTGMGFAAVARVTDERWIACSVRDDISFGLEPGMELAIETTICNEIREHRGPVVIDSVADDEVYANHPTPARYGFQSYISMPISMPDGSFFGTLCAIDPKPKNVKTPEVMGSIKLFAELIAFHLHADQRLSAVEAELTDERAVAHLREQFIAVLGHDLRNPLASVRAGVDLIRRRPERALELVEQIDQSASRMTGLIDNILDFARGRLGGGLMLTINRADPVEPMLSQVIQELQVGHPEREVSVELSLSQPVECDHVRISQLLSNLLANALTHGAADKPIRVQAVAGGRVFELSVANSGRPIPPEALGSLFQPFFRASVTPSKEGLGLGLYIASEIARAHGGTLTVSSTPAETRFTFRMPLSI